MFSFNTLAHTHTPYCCSFIVVLFAVVTFFCLCWLCLRFCQTFAHFIFNCRVYLGLIGLEIAHVLLSIFLNFLDLVYFILYEFNFIFYIYLSSYFYEVCFKYKRDLTAI